MLWRYLKHQATVLMYGAIGPFFLVLYFASDRDAFMQMFLWSGLAVTAICVITAVVMTVKEEKAAAQKADLEQNGVVALAKVLRIHETGTSIKDQPLVRLDLQISGPGIESFTSQDKVLSSMDRLSLITGRKLVVLVDPTTHQYQIDWDRTALVTGATPAVFTIDGDDSTYDLSGKVEPLMEILRIFKTNGIGLNDAVDWSSYPAVRQQMREIVRGAAAPTERKQP